MARSTEQLMQNVLSRYDVRTQREEDVKEKINKFRELCYKTFKSATFNFSLNPVYVSIGGNNYRGFKVIWKPEEIEDFYLSFKLDKTDLARIALLLRVKRKLNVYVEAPFVTYEDLLLVLYFNGIVEDMDAYSRS